MDIHHLILPKSSNNYKAHALHNISLMTFAAFLLFAHTLVNLLSAPQINILGYASNIPPEKVVELTNQKRLENGVGALSFNSSLSEAARLKALDMLEDDYWAHIAPDGKEPWDFFKSVGYSYRYAGENLARDFSDTNSAIEAWLASPSHRENMLSGKYTEIGVAVVEGDLAGKDTTLIVQLFGTPSAGAPAVPVAAAEEKVNIAEELFPVAEAQDQPVQESVIKTPPVVDPPVVLASQFDVMRAVTIAVVSVMMLLLLADLVIIARKGVVRIGGRTFAHLSFMTMVFIILILVKAGQII